MATNIKVARFDREVGSVYADLCGGAGLAASDDGAWVYIGDLTDVSVSIEGISGDTFYLYGSNAATQPSDATDHNVISGPITADALVNVAMPIRYIKMKLTYSAGTLYAHMSGHQRG